MKTVMGVGTIRLNSASAQFSANFNKVVADAETSKRFGHAIDRKALGNRRNTLQAELLAQLNSVGPAKKQALPRGSPLVFSQSKMTLCGHCEGAD
jgi:hypothetical protein